MALDDYFANPSQECLCRLFDAVNSMDLSNAPVLTRHEKLIMRASERKDVFIEMFTSVKGHTDSDGLTVKPRSGAADTSVDSRSSFEEGILARTRDDDSPLTTPQQGPPGQSSPSEASFSLGGSAVWVGDEGADHTMNGRDRERTSMSTTRNRSSLDASSISSGGAQYGGGVLHVSADAIQGIKDTHFYPTTIAYKGHQLPIKMPLSTFPEEVGDVRLLAYLGILFLFTFLCFFFLFFFQYSLIQLIQTFSTTIASVSGPSHPHLHTNGSLTHPIVILFNALITGKRIVFLGHNRPAGQVANYVLSACALGSGCGTILRGFIERAFPYANLTKRDEWESM
jgi:Stabilization of polarity axis